MKRNIFDKMTAAALAGILALSLAACAGNNGTGTASEPAPQEESQVEENDAAETPVEGIPAEEGAAEEIPFEEYYTGEEDYSDAETASGMLLGGWEKVDSPVITEEMAALVEKASANLTGAKYTPVAYLGRQIVSGTNYLILCRTVSTVDPDAVETYMFVTVYENLEGDAQISNVIDTGLPTNIADLSGGWSQAESSEVTDEIEELCDKAFEKLVGVGYKPVALLSTQVVAGMNYCVLCESTIVYPGAETTYAFVTLYKDLEGNVEVLDNWNCEQDGSVTGATIAE